MKEKKMNVLLKRKGFIAALDQSGGSSKKTLLNYGISENEYKDEEEMFLKIHDMRKRIIMSPVFSKDKILGVILFKNTMERKIEDLYTADYLWNKKEILSFLKIDLGLDTLKNGVQLLKDIPNIDETLELSLKYNIFGTKMRSVIKEANEEGIKALVNQQFSLAKVISSYGLIPIIEPEVDINAKDKAVCEELLLNEVKNELKKLDSSVNVIFKFTLPTKENFYDELLTYNNVLKLVALSGGYERDIANSKLKNNKNMIASFSRALLEGLSIKQKENEFDNVLNETINSIYDASINKIE
ncbi:MAG: fructose bisphosphate aldolase [Bacilli bacterium]